MINGAIPTEVSLAISPLKISIRLAPIIGIRTMRNENLVISSRLFFSNKPVEMVAPEREMPGNTANAWAIPIRNAFENGIFLLPDLII